MPTEQQRASMRVKSSNRTIVVIGGALAGPTAAARAREFDEAARIVLVERAPHVSYAVGGLAFELSGEIPPLDEGRRDAAALLRDSYRIEVHTGAHVQAIDPARRLVQLHEGALRYDALIYALGVQSPAPEIVGLLPAENVLALRTPRDLAGLQALIAAGARRAVVLGGGYFGIEAADALCRRGLAVTLVEQGAQLLPSFGRELAAAAAQALSDAGVTVRLGASVERAERVERAGRGRRAAEGGERLRALRLADGTRLESDLVVLATGVRPRSGLLARAGAAVTREGAVVVDARCRTSLPRVFACGTCVAVPPALGNTPYWNPQAALADKTAQVAGTNAGGGRARLGRPAGSALVRAGALVLGRAGLTRREAKRQVGSAAASLVVHAPAQEAGYPGASALTVELLYDRQNGKLLGAELAGRQGVDKRLDVVCTALVGGLTVEALAGLDLAYASPYAAARDPLNVAGSVASAARAALATPWSPELLERLRPKLTVVDVRDALGGATLAGARHLPLAMLRERWAEVPAGTLVFIDDDGRAAYLAARLARQRGRPTAGFLTGGLRSWSALGYPLKKAPA